MLVLAAVGIGVTAGVGIYTFQDAKGTAYLSNDPKACINCHVMQDYYDSWLGSSHHKAATCNDCHTPHSFPQKYIAKMRNGWNHSRAFTMQDWPEPIRISEHNRVALENNCLHCHGDLTSEIATHQDIVRGAIRCANCHSSVGHVRN